MTDRYERIRAVITFCDKCGCDWLDNGLHPVSCPYCRIRELLAERDRLADENARLREAAKSARDALAVTIKAAWEGSTDAAVAEHVVIKKLDAAIDAALAKENSDARAALAKAEGR